MTGTVTVTCQTAKSSGRKRYILTFSQLPGRKFGPWEMNETMRDLTVSALLSPVEARNLVLDAAVSGSATTEVNR